MLLQNGQARLHCSYSKNGLGPQVSPIMVLI